MNPANENIARVLADTNEVWPAEVVFQERKEVAGEAEKHAARLQSMRFQTEKFKALYEKSQELFARERGITKEQRQYIEELFSALDRLHHSYQMILSRKPVRDVEETLAEVAAALSKVQK